MKTRAKPGKTKIGDRYLQLVCEFPLRPIRSHTEYEAAIAVMEKLVVRGETDLDAGERDYLDALDAFISLYDQRHFSFPPGNRSPLDRLKYILAESGTTPTQLKALLKVSQPLVSMILSGSRELTKDNIRTLAKHFKVSPALFI